MTTRISHPGAVAAAALLLAVATLAGEPPPAPAAGAPDLVDWSRVKLEIVGVTFVRKLEGLNGTFEEPEPAKYRGMLLTLRLTKPEGDELHLLAPDFTVHYRYGESSDVSPCRGMSTFSTSPDVDRPVRFFSNGYGAMTTGAATQKAATVYLDLFFENMEPDTRDIHLLVARPIGVSIDSRGW